MTTQNAAKAGAEPGLGPSKRERRIARLQRFLPIGLLAVALVGAPVMIFSQDGLPRMQIVEQELGQVRKENQDLEREIRRLRSRITELRDNPAAVEQLARDELGMIRHSEVVFQFAK